jgi:hypothetical protein
MTARDALAMIDCRTHYLRRASELERLANQERKEGKPLNARQTLYRSKIVYRAAMAELLNPETPHA